MVVHPNELKERQDELLNEGPVRRGRVSKRTRKQFREARENGDIQRQLDILFEILTGENP